MLLSVALLFGLVTSAPGSVKVQVKGGVDTSRVRAALIERLLEEGYVLAPERGPAALELLWRAYPTEYLSDTVEALLIASAAGLRIEEVPVRMHQRQGGVASSRSLRSVLNLARIFVVIVLHPIRAPLPQRPQT